MRRIAIAAAILLAAASRAHACFIHSPLPVELVEDHITIEVTGNVAVKQYTCTFLNPNAQAVVGGTCYMEVEPGAQVDKLALKLGDREVNAELLDAEKAKKVFQGIVAKGGSPALLEFYGNGLIRAEVPRIAPGGTVTAVLRYTTIVKSESGAFRMKFLNTNPKAWLKPLRKVTVNATIRTDEPLRAVSSPTHDVRVRRIDDRTAVVTYEESNYLPKTPMALYWTAGSGDVVVSSLAHREEEERGTFLVTVSPPIAKDAPVLPREVVFCIDRSGSMVEDERLAQVQRALERCLGKLRTADRFGIVDFGTEVASFPEGGLLPPRCPPDGGATRPSPSAFGGGDPSRGDLVPATGENVKLAVEHVRAMRARGQTAIEEAATRALSMLTDSPDPKYVFFLTDGTPTDGETDPAKLAEIIKRKNARAARILAFGVGRDVNAKLLDRMALESGGTAVYVLPKEDLESRIVELHDRFASPVLSDVAVKIEGIDPADLFPRRLPDLFKGEQLVLVGRYDGAETTRREVVVTGKLSGKEVRYAYTIELPAENPKNEFLPRLWAGRKVAHLLDEIASGRPKDERIRELVPLARRYGIVTPYTSFLLGDVNGGPANEAEALQAAGTLIDAAARPAAAYGRLRTLASSASVFREGQGDRAFFDAAKAVTNRDDLALMESYRMIGEKTFYNVAGNWNDSAFDAEKHKDVVTIRQGSDECVKLIEKAPGIAKYLSLGNVIVVYRGKAYRLVNA